MKYSLRKICALILALCMASLMLPGVSARADSETDRFNEYMYNEWIDTVESDYLSMHFYVKDWKTYGLTKPELTLGTVWMEDYALSLEEDERILSDLAGFDYDALDSSAQAAYDSLKFYLECDLILSQYPQFNEMFNPYSGVLSNVITNFTEFELRSEEDVEDYLVLLGDFDRLIEDMVTVTEQQISDYGYFMPDSALTEALAEMAEFVAKGDENPLIVIFNKNVDKLGLSSAAAQDYKAQNKTIVTKEIFPAYQSASAYLEKQYGKRSIEGGICNYPGGSEYYEANLRYMTGTDLDMEEIYDMLDVSMENSLDYFYSVYNGKVIRDVSFETAEEILDYLRNNLQRFPAAPDVNYEVSYLDPSVATPSIVAYYMSAPVDDFSYNVIRVNGDAVNDINELYMTLSHEGYPGHLYQFTYWLNSGHVYELNYVIGNMGYQEGWAMYAENLLIRDSGLDASSYAYHEMDNYYNYLSSAQMDIGINGFGWTAQDLLDYLDPQGSYYTLADMTDTMDYFTSLPGTLCAYGVGDAMFMGLRSTAQLSLGDAFDEVEFHEIMLQNGSRPFATVEKDLEEYIHSKGYEMLPDIYGYDFEAGKTATPVPYEVSSEENAPAEVAPEGGENAQEGQDNSQTPNINAQPQTPNAENPDGGKTGVNAATILIIVGAVLIVAGIVITILAVNAGKKKKAKQEAPAEGMPQTPQMPQMPQGQMPQAPMYNPYMQPQGMPQAPQMPQMPQGQMPQAPMYNPYMQPQGMPQAPQMPQMPQGQMPQAPMYNPYMQPQGMPQAPQTPQTPQTPQAPQMPQGQMAQTATQKPNVNPYSQQAAPYSNNGPKQ